MEYSKEIDVRGLESARTCLRVPESEATFRPLGHNNNALFTVEGPWTKSLSAKTQFASPSVPEF